MISKIFDSEWTAAAPLILTVLVILTAVAVAFW